MTDAAAQAILEELTTVQNYMMAAQNVLDSGYMPDITALDARVAELCERIKKAPEDRHDQYLEQLAILLEHINVCEQKMKAFHATRMGGDPS